MSLWVGLSIPTPTFPLLLVVEFTFPEGTKICAFKKDVPTNRAPRIEFFTIVQKLVFNILLTGQMYRL